MPGIVTVGCRLPAGLHCDIFRMEDTVEHLMNGSGTRTMKIARKAGRFTIKGTGRRVDDPRIVYGAALTHGVDADHWALWLEQNKGADVIEKGLIFAHAKQDSVEAQARTHENERTGLEPANPDALPAEFQKVKTEKRANG